MGVKLLEIGNKMRKGVIFTMRGCFRSVCKHPFLVGFLCFLIFMYRSSPFIFSVLMSASPILICTAVLLGTLLSFGQPNIPEIEVQEKITHEVVQMKTGVSGDAIVVGQNESYYVERYSEKRRDEEGQSIEVPSLSASMLGETSRDVSSDDNDSLIEEMSRETESENGEMWEANRGRGDMRYKQKTELNGGRLKDEEEIENNNASIPKVNDKHLESDDEKSEADSFDSERVSVDSLNSLTRPSWKPVEAQEEEDPLESGSDEAENSSPDASMADIMPMLDELHPLLDEEAPQPVQMSYYASDVVSEQSPQSSTISHESDDETENHEDLEVADVDNEDGEDDEDAQEDKEEQTKSAITWTEEDQKNLMDLGSSEIERNQWLESLILRRRARKFMSMVPEMNLIDLESFDPSFHIAPISTTRQNPFDLPQDTCDNSGLPPIPGSAPSILLPRRNPFDIPYDSSEEKPNIMGDRFQQEFGTSQSREPFFRRHESFNVGPSVFAPNRQEKQDIKLRPYFVLEQTVPELSSYSPLQRQSSELSDSKLSSIPETESVGSVENMEDQMFAEEDSPQELEMVSKKEEVVEECPSGDRDLVSKREVFEEDVPQEPELMTKMKDAYGHAAHGSQSSEEEESLELGQVEKREVEFNDSKFESQDVEDHHEEGSVAQPVEFQAGYDSCSDAVEQKYIRCSSSSSLSEVSERVFSETEGEGVSVLDGRTNGIAEKPEILTQTSAESTDLNVNSALVDDIPHKDPVYDSSPPASRKNFSSSSCSSDVHAKSNEHLPPVPAKRTVSFIERDSGGISQEIQEDIPSNVKMLPKSSALHVADEHESAQVDISLPEHDNINSDFLGDDQRSESQDASTLPSGQVPSSSYDLNALIKSSDGKNLGQSEEEKHLLISKRESLSTVRVPPYKIQLEAEHSIDKEETVLSPNSDDDVYHEAKEKLIPTPSAGGSLSLFYDVTMHRPKFEHLNEVQVPNTPVESFEKVRTMENLNIPVVHEVDNDISPNINSPFSPEFISMPSITSEEASYRVDMQRVQEEVAKIKKIDGLLSELDNVGDFSTTQWRSGSNEFEKHMDSIGESLSSAHLETSTIKVVEVNSVEVNKKEHAMQLDNFRDEIDICEEDMECISELQTPETTIAEHVDKSNGEFNERDGQDSTDEIVFEEKTLSKENEAKPANSVLDHNYEDNISGIPEVNVQSIEDVDSFPRKDKLTSVGTEVLLHNAEVSHQSQVDIDMASEMPELEARTVEDIDIVFKQFNDKETEKPVILEPPQAKLVIRETITEHSNHGTLQINAQIVLGSSPEKELKPNANDGSVEDNTEKLRSIMGKKPSVKQSN